MEADKSKSSFFQVTRYGTSPSGPTATRAPHKCKYNFRDAEYNVLIYSSSITSFEVVSPLR